MAYGMNAPDLVFWVEPLGPDGGHDARVLCRRHADAMVVPRGWTLDDRREPVPRLFRPPATRSAAPSGTRDARRRRRHEQPATEPLPLETGPLETGPLETAPAAEVDGSPGPGWTPTFDPDDDLDGLLAVESPLLQRAFRGANRPRR